VGARVVRSITPPPRLALTLYQPFNAFKHELTCSPVLTLGWDNSCKPEIGFARGDETRLTRLEGRPHAQTVGAECRDKNGALNMQPRPGRLEVDARGRRAYHFVQKIGSKLKFRPANNPSIWLPLSVSDDYEESNPSAS